MATLIAVKGCKGPRAVAAGGGTSDENRRPTINVKGGTLPEQVEQSEAAMVKAGAEVYQRNGVIVRPYRLGYEQDGNGILMPSGAMVLGPVDKPWIIRAMTQCARYVRIDPRTKAEAEVDCPAKVGETYLSMVGDWKIPPVVGISECPTMRKDGSVISRSGYDRKSGVFVDYDGKPVEIPDNPGIHDAILAIEDIKQPFLQFPFVEPIDFSVLLAAILTAVVRRSLPSAPLFAFDAPKAGSGKGLLADCVSMIATGRTCAMVSQGRDESEDEKRLGSMLMRSSPVVCIDNIERAVRGDFLCTMLTQTLVTIRELGFSKMSDLPTNSTVMATGNNLVFAGDMTRRVLICRIDPECERPDAREFSLDLRAWMPANRHRLLAAALTVLRAYHVAGRPRQGILPFGSFECWSSLIRSALVWAGEEDPNKTRGRIEGDDPVSASIARVLSLWFHAVGDKPVSAAEIAREADQFANADLKDALLQIAENHRKQGLVDTVILGKWLKKYANRVQGGFFVKKAGENTHSRTTVWVVSKK